MTADDRALFVDFTRGGLWAWAPDGGYRAISLDNPHVEGMASYGGVAYLDYGPSGLWSWGLDAGWSHINAADPDDLAVAADSLYVDYGVFGLWRWTAEGGMTLLTDADARSMAVVAGDLLVGFYGAGLWQWTRADGWAKIWHFSPSLMASTLEGPTAAAGFSQSGVALWSPASGLRWLQTRAVPQALART